MAVVFTNGVVSLTDDLVFGVSVLSEEGWVPVEGLDQQSLEQVRELLDYNPSCPDKIRRAVYGANTPGA